MAKKQTAGVVNHAYAGGRNKVSAILYKLCSLPSLAKRSSADKRTAYARIISGSAMDEQELAERMVERTRYLDVDTIAYMLKVMTRIIEEELSVGRHVKLSDFLSLGLAFEGRLDPERPLDAKRLPLSPWARFSTTFIEKLNRDATIAYHSPLQPAEIRVDRVEPFSRAGITLIGKFHNIGSLSVVLRDEAGNERTCPFALRTAAKSTRQIGTKLELKPRPVLADGAYTAILSWIDGAGEEKQMEVPFTLETNEQGSAKRFASRK